MIIKCLAWSWIFFSSVIVAGIESANQLANLQLSDAEKLRIATEIEGHPDNVAPAIEIWSLRATSVKMSKYVTPTSQPWLQASYRATTIEDQR